MYSHKLHSMSDVDDIYAFIEQNRFGTLITVAAGTGCASASQMPFLLARSRGRLGTLISHMPLANAQSERVLNGAECLIMFLGPHGYISPSWYPPDGRSSAPTWNFSVAQVRGRTIPLSRRETGDYLEELVDDMEHGRPNGWRLAEMGDRFSKLLDHVCGFEVAIDEINAKHKLGQDERPEDMLAAIEMLAVGSSSEQALASAMVRCLRYAQDQGVE